ncbi:hypothetical protein KFE25_003855 [Diacronema lutheri]|uniref:PNPLA domain-containing protein n=1 Tax=Diacronema lutheri TaxID=2081491 RepID=A0A8J6C6I4_DIALT|nr:hypothetical protein KFE25_003855 [Diacronema lutheri]
MRLALLVAALVATLIAISVLLAAQHHSANDHEASPRVAPADDDGTGESLSANLVGAFFSERAERIFGTAQQNLAPLVDKLGFDADTAARHCPSINAKATAINTNTAENLKTAVDVSSSYSLRDFFGGCTGSACTGVPVGIAHSGGGWKALAQHMGVARGIIDQKLAQPEVIAGNSGGTWFVALLAYSSRFFAAVQSPTDASGSNSIGKAYMDFMAAYETLLGPDDGANRTWEASGRFKTVIELLDARELSRNFGFSWLAFIHAMFDAYQPGFAAGNASHPTNPLLRNKSALAFEIAFDPGAYLDGMNGNSAEDFLVGKVALKVTSSTPTDVVNAALPFYYVTGASGEGGTGVLVPLAKPDSVYMVGPLPSMRAPLRSALPPVPSTLASISAGSSAAAGMAGSQVLLQQAVDYRACRSDVLMGLDADRDIWPIVGAQNLAACADGSPLTCSFPSGRMIDGWYTDNLALTATLAKLQHEHPSAREFRLVSSWANTCLGELTLHDCAKYDRSLEQLFANLPIAPSGAKYPSQPGELYTESMDGPILGTRRFSAQVFAEALPQEWQAHGPSRFRTLTLNVTTVDNAPFGIKGGARVTLFVLAGNVGLACPTVIMPNADAAPVIACAGLADGMRAFLAGMELGAPISSCETGEIASP